MRDTITVNGKEYKIAQRNTTETHESAGRDAIAREYRKNGIAAQMYVTKPNGSQVFIVNEYANGNMSSAMKVDGFFI